MSHGEVLGSSTERLRSLNEKGGIAIGYLYPHSPLELILAHGLTPSLIRVSPTTSSGFEDSLQTFSCAFSRNIFSQRAKGELVEFGGFLFPGNTCDALQNVGDVWRQRFPKDKVFRLTYPASSYSEDAVLFFAEELRLLSNEIATHYGKPFSQADFAAAVVLVNDFREIARFLYASRMINHETIPYSELVDLVVHFLIAPEQQILDEAEEKMIVAKSVLANQDRIELAEKISQGLLMGRVSNLTVDKSAGKPRLLVIGGMVDPQNFTGLFAELENASDDIVTLDLLSFSFKSVFTPRVTLNGDPFRAIAESILRAPPEPTQEGLTQRVSFLKELIESFGFDGLVVCEQSFCDPDEFETPSLLRVADQLSLPSLRLPIDPELSDRNRLVGRLQTFLETLE